MESGDEDDAFTMGEREWQKMKRDMGKQGYREGKSEGREKGRQHAFEQAMSLALNHSLKLGQLLGVIEWKLSQSKEIDQRRKLGAIRDSVAGVMDRLRKCSAEENISDCETEINIAIHKLVQELLLLSVFIPEEVAGLTKCL